MKVRRLVDLVFPYIEPLAPEQQANESRRLSDDVATIDAGTFCSNEERALDEAQRVAAAETERVRTAESKATTYLAVLAALVPVITTLQTANWEKKAGPAPDAVRLSVLAIATAYVAAAGYHAFRTLQVSGFQRVGEADIAAAWRTQNPLRRLTRGTLLASRNSRKAVNAKVTRIKVTHEHLLRAFGAFVLLLLLDPLFYAMGFRNKSERPIPSGVVTLDRANPGAAPGRRGKAQPRSEPRPDRAAAAGPALQVERLGEAVAPTKAGPTPAAPRPKIGAPPPGGGGETRGRKER